MKRLDRVGKTYGQLTVISYAGHAYWNVRCSCGKEYKAPTPNFYDRTPKCIECHQKEQAAKKAATDARKATERLQRIADRKANKGDWTRFRTLETLMLRGISFNEACTRVMGITRERCRQILNNINN